MQQANSVSDWLKLAEEAQFVCLRSLEIGMYNFAWSQAGFAIECCLKAAIMAKERLNSWPTREARRDLYTHSLTELAEILGLEVDVRHEIAAAWAVSSQWRMEHRYNSAEVPYQVARGIVDAAISSEGVIPWLVNHYRLKQ